MGGGMNPNFHQGFDGNNNNAKYKTALCNNFSSTGMCKFGDTCKFAHGVDELRRHGYGGGQQNNQYNKFQNNNRGGGFQPRGNTQRGRGGFQGGQRGRGRGGFNNFRGGFNNYNGMMDQNQM